MAAQAETSIKAFPFSGGGKGVACQGGGHPRGKEECWGTGWKEAGRWWRALRSWKDDQPGPEQASDWLQENLWRCKCPTSPSLVPVISVSWQLPSSFFAVLPQSHMEVRLRWVESTTFLLITSKPGDLLWMARGLALLPPSVTAPLCITAIAVFNGLWQDAGKIHCLQL